MDDRLQKLTRDLRAEKCPPRVLAKVQERIASERRRPLFAPGFAALAGLAAVLMLTAAVVFQWTKAPESSPAPIQQAQIATKDPAKIAAEAKLSLACIGHILLKAGDHSETVLLKEAIPPLRNGFKTVQTTLKEPIGL